ncbi:hypothetical protein HSBAA_36930 [Vreelandella sulfidaeris]|uniref:Aminotransferase class I/classII large domain-containing protein n=1 Tax=Vreelandella sulfidaeris TaxID=115553 RepID=A0A455U9Y4_9GAMM|nr:hypothetical protein HSBAA_36930 [Halomonas sulfidaeris]
MLEIVRERKLLPLIDFAYQGFGEGLDEDAYGVRLLAENLDEAIITSSCSKNFGIYCERTGCLIMVAKTASRWITSVHRSLLLPVKTTQTRPLTVAQLSARFSTTQN